ncbi:MAG: sel1 repeat family protein [Micavibrio sp.]|nr:MAG: sel1 repeat family protein [Micavibrio sp.]
MKNGLSKYLSLKSFKMKIAIFCLISVVAFLSVATSAESSREGVISACGKSSEYLQSLEARAGRGDVEAIIEMADEYTTGNCYARNISRAETLLQRATDLGSLDALYQLARLNIIEPGVGRVQVNARRQALHNVLVQLANLGYMPAQYDLGIFHLRGMYGFPQNTDTAVQWLQKAGEVGNMRAARIAAQILLTGHGNVRPNRVLGETWLRGAAHGGDMVAVKMLAEHLQAQDATKNMAEVIQLYEHLAQKGLHSVGKELGAFYETFEQPETAYYWYKIAEAYGVNIGNRASQMEWRMESSHIRNIQQQVENFNENYPPLNRHYRQR